MKKLVLITLILFMIISCKNDRQKTSNDEPLQKEESAEKLETTKKKVLSPHTSAMAMVGDAHIHIDYSSPGVRNRIIFGGLVAYDSIWQAGAHMVTWMQINKDLKIQGNDLPAGKYALFMIPSQDEWTIIFNKHWEQHGKDEYDEKDDVMRFKVRPEISEEITEHLVYEVNETGTAEGMISFSWEKVTMSFRFEVIE
ncbi:MAG: DUF2911 domain-containing protein [Bacteroidetes bacterium]|nr:MAG: DUF2911 domain-containing protein [Bacteroidota bacterium]